MDKFGWAYIGCGSIAHTTAKELVKTDDNQIVAVWNRTTAKAEEFAKEYGGTVYATAEEAINAAGVEGVYVNVNGDMHAEFTKLSIKNKKPVLCEKPFAVNEKVTKEVFDYAAEKDVYVSEAMWTWHNETALQVKEWVKSGVIGDIQSVDCAFAVPLLKHSDNPRLTTPSMLGGALLDLGVYAVRYCYELFGIPEQIKCEGDMHEVDHAEKIEFQYPGFQAKMHISMKEDAGNFFEIKGTKGAISVPKFNSSKQAYLKTDGKEEVFEMAGLLYGNQFSNVAAEIRAGRKEGEKISGKSTIEVMALLDECRRQMGLVYPQEQSKDLAGDNSK
ncbi:Gfo/Idh/MocA family protein [Alkalibacterium sp. f15]|uniref:Gfo/Idh/MocA family protein n=1 Tax=Alkalibacterium sp. f15 TaxID=3414029 RepID=UPI003BF896B0